eukprot:3631062-Amphidinium_carterae.2
MADVRALVLVHMGPRPQYKPPQLRCLQVSRCAFHAARLNFLRSLSDMPVAVLTPAGSAKRK